MPNDLDHILTEGQCLDNEQIRRYLEGDPEVQRPVEKHLVDCELCNAAVEGFAVVPAFATVDGLNAQVRAKAAAGQGFGWMPIAVVVGVAVIITAVFIYWPKDEQITAEPFVADVPEINEDQIIPTDSMQLQSELEPSQEPVVEKLLEKAIAEQPEVTTDTEEALLIVRGPGPEKVLVRRTERVQPSSAATSNGEKRPKVWSNVHVAFVHDLVVVDYGKILSSGVSKIDEHHGGLHPRYENKQDRTIITFEPTTYTIPYLEFLDEAMAGFAQGMPSRSLAQLEYLLSEHQDDVNGLFYSGLCFYHLGQPEKAIQRFDAAINSSINTFYEEAKWYKALSLEMKGDKAAAKKLMEEIEEEGGFYSNRAKKRLLSMEYRK